MPFQSIFVISEKKESLYELCFGARKLSDQVTAVIFGDRTAAENVADCGAKCVLYCPTESCIPEDYCKAIASEVKKSPCALVLLNNSVRSRCIAGKLGAYLDTAVITCASEIVADNGDIVCKRTVYGGAAISSQAFTGSYGVITVGNGIFGDIDAKYPVTEKIEQISEKPECTVKIIARNEKKSGGTNLAAAKRIVDVGRGLASEEDLDMCNQLASLLDAEVGCSRPVAENNKWMPISNYIGLTGTTVKPDLLFALGVSGQVQHIAGINKSKVIVAINKDKNAPIFKNADFGIVGDIYKIVPALIKKLS
ncbi:MAG: electron transfer flavoprotein subunit alpha/FixB family protein [Clostridiales bacterium]|nr:electron transfer flavoprotein subunit alpha/FixB family protein [Clostridiales bacterium]